MNKKIILFSLFLILGQLSWANDSAYYLEGNHLIPITDSDIEVSKEILSIKREGQFIFVTVDYTFTNKGKAKTILVGFEASSPVGDVNNYPKNGEHPYITHFKVVMNDKLVPHKVAIVDNENYFIHNKIDAKTTKEVTSSKAFRDCPECPNFFYVYYFNANFKSGVNKLIHTYKFKASGGVMQTYMIDYVLTAAMRWANKQIDDFTLNINVGDFEIFYMSETFFSGTKNWTVEDGVIGMVDDMLKIRTFRGGITFKAKNFKPKGELHLFANREDWASRFFRVGDDLPSKVYTGKPLKNNDPFLLYPPYMMADKKAFKILRNLPFAVRGYVFKTEFIQNYYENQSWYKPNPAYQDASLDDLSEKEKKWLETVKSYGNNLKE